MIPLLLIMVSVATNAFREATHIEQGSWLQPAAVRETSAKVESLDSNSSLHGQEKMGILDWYGCEMYTNMSIVGTRSLCFKASMVAHHCFSVLDVEDADKGVKPSLEPREGGDEPGDVDVNVSVTANWQDRDLLMLDPWELRWVPVRIWDVTDDGIQLRHFSSYWKWYRVSRSTRFRTFRPKSLLLELSGESDCVTDPGKEHFTVAKVHCVASPLKLDAQNMEYAKVISNVGAYRNPAEEHQPFVEAGPTLGKYWSWKDYETALPATVGGLKAWSEKYLHGYPEYKTMSHNCQQFEMGVYQAVAKQAVAAFRKQGYTKALKLFEGAFTGSSQSSGTTENADLCKCYCKPKLGLNKRDKATGVCVYDWSCTQYIWGFWQDER